MRPASHLIRRGAIGLVLVAALALPVLPAGAQGCGPTRLKVSESVVLDLPPARVWAAVGDFQDMSWDGDVATASGAGASEPGAVRTLHLRDGAVLGESLYRFDAAAMTYSTHLDAADRLPVQNASLTLDVVPEAGGSRSRLVWRSAFYRLLKPGETSPDAADAEASRAMSTYLRSALDGLKVRLDATPAPRT